MLLVAILSLGLIAASCSKDDTTSTGGSGGTTAGTTASSGASADMDFSKLSGSLPGSGATFPKAFYEEAIAEFMTVAPDLEVTYAGGGSGKGKQDLADQVVPWAGTDSLIKDEDKANFKGGEVLYFPTVAAPITVSYNLSGVDELQLSPDTLAGIMERKITTWNAEEIAADNPGVTLPDTPIAVVHRSDGSGTTTNFTTYLTKAAPDTWTLGKGDTVQWPADTLAGNGNSGVAQTIKDTNGAIGYVDLSDAKASGLTFAAIENADGNFVQPTLEGASAALAGADVKPDLTYDPLNASGADAYPITAPTYIITYQTQPDQTTLDNVKGWIGYVLTDAQDYAADVDFATLPASLQEKALAQLETLST